MGKVSADALWGDDLQSRTTMAALFGIILSTKGKDHEGKLVPLHQMIDGKTETKQAWVTHTKDMFYTTSFSGLGLLMLYEPNTGKEWQNKLKNVELENAKYFHERYLHRREEQGPYATFDLREERGYKIWDERLKSIADNERRKQEEKEGGGKKRKKASLKAKKKAEKNIGLVSPGRGVSAPSLKKPLTSNQKLALSMLGAQPESPTCMYFMCIDLTTSAEYQICFMFLLSLDHKHSKPKKKKKTSDSDELSLSSYIEDGSDDDEDSPSSSGDNCSSEGCTVKERLPEEKENAKQAASKAAQAKAESKKKKKGKGEKSRIMPTHQDMVDLADNITNRLEANKGDTETLTALAHQVIEQQALRATTRTNTPKSSPHTKRTKMRKEIQDEEDIIEKLDRRLQRLTEKGATEEKIHQVKDCIEKHEKQVVNLNKKFFEEWQDL
jgi:hypothetical protein